MSNTFNYLWSAIVLLKDWIKFEEWTWELGEGQLEIKPKEAIQFEGTHQLEYLEKSKYSSFKDMSYKSIQTLC